MKTSYKNLKKNDDPDRPMGVEIKNKVLTIRIGLNTLAWALEHMPRNYDETAYEATNIDAFAVDVRNELLREEEDGTTALCELLDNAINEAINHGSIFVKEKEAANED